MNGCGVRFSRIRQKKHSTTQKHLCNSAYTWKNTHKIFRIHTLYYLIPFQKITRKQTCGQLPTNQNQQKSFNQYFRIKEFIFPKETNSFKRAFLLLLSFLFKTIKTYNQRLWAAHMPTNAFRDTFFILINFFTARIVEKSTITTQVKQLK